MLAPAKDARLIIGELPETNDPEDARQWLTIYRELVSFAQRTRNRLRAASAADADVNALEVHLERLQARLSYWEERVWQLAGIDLDLRSRTVSYGDRRIRLTRREMELLAFLAQRPQQDFSAEHLLTQAWGKVDLSEEQLRTYVVRLRRRLAEAQLPVALVTVPRRGYRLVFLAPQRIHGVDALGHLPARLR